MANCKTCGTVLNTPTGVETVYCRECDPEYLDAARGDIVGLKTLCDRLVVTCEKLLNERADLLALRSIDQERIAELTAEIEGAAMERLRGEKERQP